MCGRVPQIRSELSGMFSKTVLQRGRRSPSLEGPVHLLYHLIALIIRRIPRAYVLKKEAPYFSIM